MFSYKSWNQASDSTTAWIYFEGGSYYPIRIVYANFVSAGGIQLDVTPPNSQISSNVGAFVYQLVDNPSNVCSARTISTVISSATTYILNNSQATTVTEPYTYTTDGFTTVVIQDQVHVSANTRTLVNYVSGSSIYTSSYLSTFIQAGETVVEKVVDVGVPVLSTSTMYATVGITKTTNSVITETVKTGILTSSVIIVQEPNLQYTYIESNVQEVTTQTSAFTTNVNGEAVFTSEIVVIGPSLSTTTVFYNGITTFTTTYTSVVTHNGRPWTHRGCQIHIPRCHSTTTWNKGCYSRSTVTEYYTTKGCVHSQEIVVHAYPSISYSYTTGTDYSQHFETYTKTDVKQGQTSEYLEVIVIYPTPSTIISVGTIETEYVMTTRGRTYVVVENTTFPTTTVFSTNQQVITTYTTQVTGTSTGWVWQVIYPTPETVTTEWTETYTAHVTSTLTFQDVVTGFKEIVYVPQSSSESISSWEETLYSTIIPTGVSSNHLDVNHVSTNKNTYSLPPLISTSTWSNSFLSTAYSLTTYTPPSDFPVTTVETVVLVPSSSSSVYTSNTTNLSTVPATNCLLTTSTSSTVVTYSGTEITSFDIIVKTPGPSCSSSSILDHSSVIPPVTSYANLSSSSSVSSPSSLSSTTTLSSASTISIISSNSFGISSSVTSPDSSISVTVSSSFGSSNSFGSSTLVTLSKSSSAPLSSSLGSSSPVSSESSGTLTPQSSSVIPSSSGVPSIASSSSTFATFSTSESVVVVSSSSFSSSSGYTSNTTNLTTIPATNCLLTTSTSSTVVTYSGTEIASFDIIIKTPGPSCSSSSILDHSTLIPSITSYANLSSSVVSSSSDTLSSDSTISVTPSSSLDSSSPAVSSTFATLSSSIATNPLSDSFTSLNSSTLSKISGSSSPTASFSSFEVPSSVASSDFGVLSSPILLSTSHSPVNSFTVLTPFSLISTKTTTTTIAATDCTSTTITLTTSVDSVPVVSVIVKTLASTSSLSSILAQSIEIYPASDCHQTTETITLTVPNSDNQITTTTSVIVRQPTGSCPISLSTTSSTNVSSSTEVPSSAEVSFSSEVSSTIEIPSPADSISTTDIPSTVTQTLQASDCVFSMTTSAFVTTISNTAFTNVVEIFYTPAPKCDIIVTTETAIGCQPYTYTSHIGTVNNFGKYINATLIVIETPGSTCLGLSSLYPEASTVNSLPLTKTTNPTNTIEFTTQVVTVSTLVTTTCTGNRCTTIPVGTTSLTKIVTMTTTTCPETSAIIPTFEVSTTGLTVSNTKNGSAIEAPSAQTATDIPSVLNGTTSSEISNVTNVAQVSNETTRAATSNEANVPPLSKAANFSPTDALAVSTAVNFPAVSASTTVSPNGDLLSQTAPSALPANTTESITILTTVSLTPSNTLSVSIPAAEASISIYEASAPKTNVIYSLMYFVLAAVCLL
jgi:hypothetical protein